MASFRASFEKELKQRLIQKATSHVSEEALLMKNFKYFDLNNSGDVDKNEFIKVIEKIGIPIFNKQDFIDLFNYYDTNGNGTLDYKEFAAVLFGNPSVSNKSNSPQKSSGRKKNQGQTQEDSVAKFQQKLRSRGATGIFGIARQFKILDDDNSRSLDLVEFTKAVKDFGVDLEDEQIEDVFDYFDRNKDSTINYDEFLLGMRGPLNQKRKRLISQAFQIIDNDGSGILDIQDIKRVYSGKMHPDVRSGKRTEESVLQEFLSTFETYVGFRGIKNGQVSPLEFEDYYAFVSASIDRDDYFELMINNAWRMNEGANLNTNKPGWSNKDNQQESLQNSYKNKPQQQPQQQTQPQPSRQTQNNNQAQVLLPPPVSIQSREEKEKRQPATQFSQQNFQNQQQQGKQSVGNEQDILSRVRAQLAARGTRGFIGLQRQFKIMDDNFDKCISYQEFKKSLNDYKMGLTDPEIQQLFKLLDVNGKGNLEITGLVKSLQGEMSEKRLKLVNQAYNKLNKNKSGVLLLNDIKGVYSAKYHPDVKKRTKTEDEVLGEFLETFELHHHLKAGMKEQRVSQEEFKEYYNNVSCSIDDDQYFEQILVNAYKLDQDNPSGQQYSSGNYLSTQNQQVVSDLRSKTIQNAPFGTSSIPTDYSTNLRPLTASNQAFQNAQYDNYAGNSTGQQKSLMSQGLPTYQQQQQQQQQQQFQSGNDRFKNNEQQSDNLSIQSQRSERSSAQSQRNETFSQRSQPQSQRSQAQSGRNIEQSSVSGDNLNGEQLFQVFRKKIISRGTRGIQSIGRLFRVVDDDKSKSINLEEFQKACKDLRIGLNEQQVKTLFQTFDRDGSDSVDYDEFLRAVRGQMNKFRLDLILAVFAKLDKNKNGSIEVDDILGLYNTSKHPEVESGRKTEEELLGEFLDTFEQHHALQTGNQRGRNKQVSVDEFVEYYNNVSASIDDDKYFEFVIRNGWKI